MLRLASHKRASRTSRQPVRCDLRRYRMPITRRGRIRIHSVCGSRSRQRVGHDKLTDLQSFDCQILDGDRLQIRFANCQPTDNKPADSQGAQCKCTDCERTQRVGTYRGTADCELPKILRIYHRITPSRAMSHMGALVQILQNARSRRSWTLEVDPIWLCSQRCLPDLRHCRLASAKLVLDPLCQFDAADHHP